MREEVLLRSTPPENSAAQLSNRAGLPSRRVALLWSFRCLAYRRCSLPVLAGLRAPGDAHAYEPRHVQHARMSDVAVRYAQSNPWPSTYLVAAHRVTYERRATSHCILRQRLQGKCVKVSNSILLPNGRIACFCDRKRGALSWLYQHRLS